MQASKSRVFFFGWLGGCGALVAAGLVVLVQLRVTVRAEGWALDHARSEYETLVVDGSASIPKAPDATAGAIALADQQLKDAAQKLRTGADAVLASIPHGGVTDTYFWIAATSEYLRQEAGRMNVRVKADEHFGLSAFATHGPSKAQIADVETQTAVIRYLVEILLRAGPDELLGVHREPAKPEASGPSRLRTVIDKNPDYFAGEIHEPTRIPSVMTSWFFRLEFTGPTSVLRDLLNEIAAGPAPLLVRQVEAEPVTAQSSPKSSASLSRAPGGAQSRFAVVVEFVEPVKTTNSLPK